MIGINLSLASRGGGAHNTNMAAPPNSAQIFYDFTQEIAADSIQFTRASTGYAPDMAGLLSQFGINQARLTDAGLLIEPSAINVLKYSNEFLGTVWYYDASNITLTPNATIAPDGTPTACLVDVQTNAFGDFGQNLNLIANTQYTFSFYIKNIDKSKLELRVYGHGGVGDLISDPSYHTQVNTSTWSRVSISFTTPSTGLYWTAIYSASNNIGKFYVWGVQIETNTTASSLIHTTSQPVTRAQDHVLIGEIATALSGGSLGIITLDLELPSLTPGLTPTYFSLANENGSHAIRVNRDVNGYCKIFVKINNNSQNILSLGQMLIGRNKISLGLGNNGEISASLNGQTRKIATTNLTDFSGFSKAYLGTDETGLTQETSRHRTLSFHIEPPIASRLEVLSTL